MVGVDMSSLARIDNKKKIYFDSWERTKKYFIHFTEHQKKLALWLGEYLYIC